MITLNAILDESWFTILLIGIIHVLIKEYILVHEIIKEKFKNKKNIIELAFEFRYLVYGFLLILLSFSIIRWLFNILSPTSANCTVDKNAVFKIEFFQILNSYAEYTGLISTLLLCIAGLIIMVSAGGKWMINLSKLLITISFLYILLSIFIGCSY